MDDVRIGTVLRALRRRRGWRQVDVAARAGCSQQSVSLIERGHLESLRTLRAVLATMDARAAVEVRWRGGELDRLLDEAHAALVMAATARLEAAGWETRTEVTYSIYGERGSIDLIGWRGFDRALLVVEVKTDITSAEATLRKHDEKVRLASRVVDERFGWRPRSVSRLLALPDTRTARRRVGAGTLIAARYPVSGAALRAWLRAPDTTISGKLLLASTNGSGSSRRIEGPRARTRG